MNLLWHSPESIRGVNGESCLWLDTAAGRLCTFAVLAALEWSLLPFTQVAFHKAVFVRAGAVSIACFLALALSRVKSLREPLPLGWTALIGHGLTLFVATAWRPGAAQPLIPLSQPVRDLVNLAGLALLALALLPWPALVRVLRLSHPAWLYSLFAGALAVKLRDPFQYLWDSPSHGLGAVLQPYTFRLVAAILHPAIPTLRTNSALAVIGTRRCMIYIAHSCSGLEGLGLIIAFSAVWLWVTRRQIRTSRAVLLVPVALAAIWLINAVRIAALVWIGNAYSPQVALGGFHAQAGWIGFSLVALGFAHFAGRLAWLRRDGATLVAASGSPQLEAVSGEPPATRAFLVPFLAILAATFLSRAFSASFEPLYPLRLIAALVALWCFRRELAQLDWRFDWRAPAAGAAVIALWLAPSILGWTHAASPLGAALAALPAWQRIGWLAARIAAAVVTVPIAEELAFRGYLARRLAGREFDQVPFIRLDRGNDRRYGLCAASAQTRTHR